MYKTKYFNIRELCHPDIISSIGEHNSWLRLDEFCLMDLDIIRKRWGSPIYINIDQFDSRGLRPPNDPDGAFYSIHKSGKAFDLVPKNGKTEELYQFLVRLIISGDLHSINTLEHKSYTVHRGWVHIACMNTEKRPLIIKP